MTSPGDVLRVPKPGSRLGHAWDLDWTEFDEVTRHGMLLDQSDRTFSTSGTSGCPKAWSRSGRQLAAETEALASLVTRTPDVVHATVGPNTLYGHASLMLGAHLGIKTVFDQWASNDICIEGERPLIIAVAASLRRLLPILQNTSVIEVTAFHSGSTVPSNLATFLRGFDGAEHVELIDVFGTTETGALGARHVLRGEEHWTLLPDVNLEFTDLDSFGEGRPCVSSPRVGLCDALMRAGSVVIDDWLRPVDEDRFAFNGRRERLVKPGGRPVDLDVLEDQIASQLPSRDIACIPVKDEDLGETVEVLVRGSDSDAAAVASSISAFRSLLNFAPSIVRAVPKIDRSPMGKVRRLQPVS